MNEPKPDESSSILTEDKIYEIGSRFYKNFSIIERLPELPEFLIAQRDLTASIVKAKVRGIKDAEIKRLKEELADCEKIQQVRVERIFKEIENKAHHTDLIDTIRVNLDWLDWQALKKQEGVE